MRLLILAFTLVCGASAQYIYSWDETPNRQYTGSEARAFCKRYGQEWEPISLNSQQKNSQFQNVLANKNDQRYFWTSGHRDNSGNWVWADNSPVGNFGWSHTGFSNTRQPDNREQPENCLGVLKNVYNDGIVWHDIHCSHKKHVICERSGGGSSRGNNNGFRGNRFNSNNFGRNNNFRRNNNRNRNRQSNSIDHFRIRG